MGSLAGDMSRLHREIDTLRKTRGSFIKDLEQDVARMKSGVADMQSDIRNSHTEAAQKMRDNLGTFISSLKSEVAGMMETFRNDRIKISEKTRAEMISFLSDVKGYVLSLAEDAAFMQKGFRDDHAEMAGKMKRDLGTFISSLKSEVAGMLSGFGNDRSEMSKEAKADREKFLSRLRQSLYDLRSETSRFRSEIAADLAGARKAWAGNLPVEPGVRDRKPLQVHVEEAGSEVEEAEAAEEIIADDLTRVHGIGPSRQERLNAAGIYTFAQLATCIPEEIKEILGPSGKLGNVRVWIEEAKALA